MYAADLQSPTPPFSDQPREAHVFDDRDNPTIKLSYWRGLAERFGLDGNTLNVEAVQA